LHVTPPRCFVFLCGFFEISADGNSATTRIYAKIVQIVRLCFFNRLGMESVQHWENKCQMFAMKETKKEGTSSQHMVGRISQPKTMI